MRKPLQIFVFCRGFDPAGDGEPHTALMNIRQRLEIMCRGSLTITSEINRGDSGGGDDSGQHVRMNLLSVTSSF